MDREAYLAELQSRLSGRIAAAELERIMVYYRTYFQESGPQREQAVIEELGRPETLAARILGELPVTPPPTMRERGWPLAAALFLVPLFLILAVVVGIAAVGVFLGFAAGGLAAGWSGIVTIGGGFSVLFRCGLATTMLYCGLGLLAIGGGLLLILLGLVLGRLCIKGTAALGGLALRRGRGRPA